MNLEVQANCWHGGGLFPCKRAAPQKWHRRPADARMGSMPMPRSNASPALWLLLHTFSRRNKRRKKLSCTVPARFSGCHCTATQNGSVGSSSLDHPIRRKRRRHQPLPDFRNPLVMPRTKPPAHPSRRPRQMPPRPISTACALLRSPARRCSIAIASPAATSGKC